ncbi:MAG: ABC transporter ATP-binding protein [Trueperaceae bacterium]|nr:ABC transporter ATP-binding protein [Trueperaceae bacterium]
MAKIELIDVAHEYQIGSGDYAVKDINITWNDGVSSALLGPSGCGKTTLLKIISGLLRPSEGTVLLDGEDVTGLSPQERNVAQVFQFPVVYETLSVFDNLAFPLRNRGANKQEVRERVHEIAEMLDLQDLLKKGASSLGAAEKQRISLGRGIVRKDTTAVLFDEPLTVIDPHMKWHLRRKLKELHARLGLTMVYVTHDQHEALTFAEQVTVMDVGEALQTGSPRALHTRPAAPFVGYFIGSPGMNLFDATLQDDGVMVGDLKLSYPSETLQGLGGKKLQVGIRPEFIEVRSDPDDGAIKSTVEAVNLTGSSLILDLAGKGLDFKVRVMEDADVNEGDTLYATFPDERVILYADGRAVKSTLKEAA